MTLADVPETLRPTLGAGIRELVKAVGQGPTNGRYLTRDEARLALEAILDGVATRAQAGALLLLQRYRGEGPEELLGYVDAIRARARMIAPDVAGMLDIGSPYDGRLKHVVVSPAASIVAAAAGVPVLMHGERDLGPKKGLAIGAVLSALGVDTDAEPEVVERGIETCGLGYLRQARAVADLHAIKPLREELGLRSPLHMVEKIYGLGGAPYHLIGVAHMPYLEQLAPALAGLGYTRTMVVQGMEGHEDVATSRGSRVVEITADGAREEWRLDPRSLGLEPASDQDLAPGDAERSARMTRSVLEGDASPSQRDLVLLNAALRIKLAGRAADVTAALVAARAAVDSGEALRGMRAWAAVA
jgi:anthranilate phosphoribosyltransferase